jgi:hypothetical protein
MDAVAAQPDHDRRNRPSHSGRLRTAGEPADFE